MDKEAYNNFLAAIIKPSKVSESELTQVLLPFLDNSFELSEIFNDILERELLLGYDDPKPQLSENYLDNFYLALKLALKNGMNPNDIIPYGDGDEGGDNIMWSVVGYLRHNDYASKILKLLLENGGNTNLKLGYSETVFSKVDYFFWLNGESMSQNLLYCWLLLAVYGGDSDNIDFLPLRMLNGHSIDELKNYEKFSFAFKMAESSEYKRTRVLFVVDRVTCKNIAVNETPFG